MVFASVAYACQSLTTAAVNPKSGPAGSTVNVTGCNYSNAAQVEVRLDSRTAAPAAWYRDADQRLASTPASPSPPAPRSATTPS